MAPTDMIIFFLEIAVMLSMALICGQVMSKLRFPAVFGELFGGIILGPTVWGWLSPDTYNWIFPETGAIFQEGMLSSRFACFSFVRRRPGNESEHH